MATYQVNKIEPKAVGRRLGLGTGDRRVLVSAENGALATLREGIGASFLCLVDV